MPSKPDQQDVEVQTVYAGFAEHRVPGRREISLRENQLVSFHNILYAKKGGKAPLRPMGSADADLSGIRFFFRLRQIGADFQQSIVQISRDRVAVDVLGQREGTAHLRNVPFANVEVGLVFLFLVLVRDLYDKPVRSAVVLDGHLVFFHTRCVDVDVQHIFFHVHVATQVLAISRENREKVQTGRTTVEERIVEKRIQNVFVCSDWFHVSLHPALLYGVH